MRTGAVSTAPTDDVPREPLERFAAALQRLNPDDGPIGLAVSGGPDSMAMLLLAHATIPGRFEVATVNHGLRPEAVDECALVVAACADRGVPCAVLPVQIADGNIQARAREARYAALCGWADASGLTAIATAHHADDQAETLLMRLNRGSGVAGLAGIRDVHRPTGCNVAIIRPLLQLRRSDLRRVVDSARLQVVDDPSNADDRFDRVRVRKALAQADWLDPLALSRSASHLAEADDALETMADSAMRDRVVQDQATTICSAIAETAIALRVIGRIVRSFGGEPRGADLGRMLHALRRGGPANVAGVLAKVENDNWIFRPEPPRRTR